MTARPLATTATTAPVAIQATAVRNALTGDGDLFQAIADWREARDEYEAERTRQRAIYDRANNQADAEMPEYGRLQDAFIKALSAAPSHERTPDQRRAVDGAEAAFEPYRKAYNRRLAELGYDEDVTDELLDNCWDWCLYAVQLPARTLAGLKAKIEMVMVEEPLDGDGELENEIPSKIWVAIVEDIRRVAGRVQS